MRTPPSPRIRRRAHRTQDCAPRPGPAPIPSPPWRRPAAGNQPPPLSGFDPLACDPALADAVQPRGCGRRPAHARARWRSSSARRRPASTPGWPTPTRPCCAPTTGTAGRIDDVEMHPSWHWLMGTSVGWGLHATPWVAPAGSGAHVARAAGFYLMNQLENGALLPDLDDVRGRSGAAARRGARGAVRTRAARPALRSRPGGTGRQGRAARGHVDDRGAGRLGPAGGRDAGRAGRRRHLPGDRAEVVHLRADAATCS